MRGFFAHFNPLRTNKAKVFPDSAALPLPPRLSRLPVSLAASLAAESSSRQGKEERAISSPELPSLSKHKRGADLLDTYISC